MNERRPLTTAITSNSAGLDAETVRSFVKQQPVSDSSFATDSVKNEGTDFSIRRDSNISNIVEKIEGGPSPTKSKKASRFQRIGLIPVTIRLRPEIAVGLKRASLELELDGEEVFTQQDLVENALEPWLRKNGFLS
jgi:hypothetical protein